MIKKDMKATVRYIIKKESEPLIAKIDKKYKVDKDIIIKRICRKYGYTLSDYYIINSK